MSEGKLKWNKKIINFIQNEKFVKIIMYAFIIINVVDAISTIVGYYVFPNFYEIATVTRIAIDYLGIWIAMVGLKAILLSYCCYRLGTRINCGDERWHFNLIFTGVSIWFVTAVISNFRYLFLEWGII